jgi:hypothetical protein
VPTTPNRNEARVVLTGKPGNGLVLDNIDTADPENEVNQLVKAITDKKGQMTDEDRKRKDRLAYQGALYLNADKTGLVLPYRCIKRALRSGAYLVGGTALSGKVNAGVESTGLLEFPINYYASSLEPGKTLPPAGPPPTALYDNERYRLRLMVNKNPSGKKTMVPSVRPVLPDWSMELTLTVFNEIVGWDAFVRALEVTGESVGIGNARQLGYGRFHTSVTKI